MLVSVQTQGPGVPDKLRLCRHLSKGNTHNASTNSYIDKGKFPTKVGTASNVTDIVSFPPTSTLPVFPALPQPLPRFPADLPTLPRPTLPYFSSYPYARAYTYPIFFPPRRVRARLPYPYSPMTSPRACDSIPLPLPLPARLP
jgi:hypothetical protein